MGGGHDMHGHSGGAKGFVSNLVHGGQGQGHGHGHGHGHGYEQGYGHGQQHGYYPPPAAGAYPPQSYPAHGYAPAAYPALSAQHGKHARRAPAISFVASDRKIGRGGVIDD